MTFPRPNGARFLRASPPTEGTLMRRLTITASALAAIGLLTTPALGASGQVSICHATASATNPSF